MGAEISKTALTPDEEAWAKQKAHDDIHGTTVAGEAPQQIIAARLPRTDSVVAVDGGRLPQRQPSEQTRLPVAPEAQQDDRAKELLQQERLQHDHSPKDRTEKERLDNEGTEKGRLAGERAEQEQRQPTLTPQQQTGAQKLRDKENAEKHRLRIERSKKERLERDASEAAKRTSTLHADHGATMWHQTKATSQANAAGAHRKKLGEQAAALEAEAEKNRKALQERQEKSRRENEQQRVVQQAESENGHARPLSIEPSQQGARRDVAPRQSMSTRQDPQSIATSSKRPPTEPERGMPKRSRYGVSSSSPMSSEGSDAEIERQPPHWYLATKKDNSRNADDSQADTLMKRLKTKITKCKSGGGNEADFHGIRRCLHELVFQKVNGKLLRKNLMLHNYDGLPQLFDQRYSNDIEYPFDIRADGEELYNRWCSGVFETDLLRGIIAKGGAAGVDRNADSIDPRWPTVSARYHGNGKLVNGQWWPTQLTTFRDGAHGVTQGGICGATGHGAYSCILSGGQDYADEDHGDWLLYCGTDSKTGEPTDYTKHMIESVSSGLPVRLLRSHNCHSQWAPQHGFRYDGLYDVVSMEKLDPPGSLRQRHRFRLERRLNQDPIRGGQGPATRPTQQEVEAYTKDQRFRGIGVKGKKGTVFPTFG